MSDVPSFKLLPHPADIILTSKGNNISELLIYAGLGLMSFMFEIKDFNEKTEMEINVDGQDLDDLYFNFVDEVLFCYQSKSFVTKNIKIKNIDEENLTVEAVLIGEIYDNSLHSNYVGTDVKAVTAAQLETRCENGIYYGSLVLDL